MTGTLQEQISFYTRMLMGVVVIAALVAVMAARPAHASTTFTVTNTNDSGAGSLRAALDGANSNPGADTINFNIPGTGVHTIQPNLGKGSLPTITDPVTINGYSQSGASPNTLSQGTNAKLMIKLDGVGDLGTTGKGRGLDIDASNVVVKGLVINHFAYGITVDDGASNARIEGNFIGTDPSGTQPKPNQYDGVYIYDRMGTTNNIVGGPTLAARNLISSNDYYGVEITSSNRRSWKRLLLLRDDQEGQPGTEHNRNSYKLHYGGYLRVLSPEEGGRLVAPLQLDASRNGRLFSKPAISRSGPVFFELSTWHMRKMCQVDNRICPIW